MRTEEEVATYVQATDPSAPGVVDTSDFGPYRIDVTKNEFKDWLPSANLRWNLTDDLVLRLAATRTLTAVRAAAFLR